MNKWVFFLYLQILVFQKLTATCPSAITPMPTLPVPAVVPPTTSSCGGPTPDAVADYLSIVIVNNSGLDAGQVYITVLVNSLTGYVSFAANGDGHMIGTINSSFASNTYLSSQTAPNHYTYTLADFEKIASNQYAFYIPNTGNSSTSPSTVMASSRIFISLKEPLTYFINNVGALGTPSEFDVKNDNYYVLTDKVEFDIGSNGLNRLNLNLTGVDFFGLPLRVQADYQYFYGGNYFEYCAVTGMPDAVSLSDVFTTYATELTHLSSPFDTHWGGLVATYTNPDDTVCKLRIFAPATAMGNTQSQSNPSTITFPTDYFLSSISSPATCSWFNAVWLGKTLSGETAFYQRTPQPYLILSANTDSGTGTAKGKAAADGSFKFTIKGIGTNPNPDKGKTVTFPKPTSSKAFFTGAVADYEPPIISGASAATNAELLKGFASCIIAGLFPINCQAVDPITINKDYVQTRSADYFQNNSILTSALSGCNCVGNVPWWDFYSRTLLTIGQPNIFYTSAYSDYLGTDGTIVVTSLNDNNADAVVSIYIGDCNTDIVFPTPYSDTTTYTVTIGIPTNTDHVQVATIGYGTSISGPFTPYSSGTFTSNGDELFIQVEYTAGVYNGQTYVTQIAPSVGVFHPILPGSGNIVTSGTDTTIYVGASP